MSDKQNHDVTIREWDAFNQRLAVFLDCVYSLTTVFVNLNLLVYFAYVHQAQ